MDMLSRALQNKKLLSLELKTKEDPDYFVTAVAGLEIQYKHNLYEDDNTAAIVSATGPEYTMTILSKTRRLESDGTLMFDNLIEALTQNWRLISLSTEKCSSTPSETNLVAFYATKSSGVDSN